MYFTATISDSTELIFYNGLSNLCSSKKLNSSDHKLSTSC